MAPAFEDGIFGASEVMRKSGTGFHRYEDGGIASFGAKVFGQAEERGRFANLAWGVDDKIESVVD